MANSPAIDLAPALTQALIAHMGDVHILISDGHYHAAGTQLSQVVQAVILNQEAINRASEAAENARCLHREGPFGGYDYGHNNDQPVKGGRYVVRDFRDPNSPSWGQWLHQTDDREEHEAIFKKMTDEHIVRASITALFAEAPASSR